MPSHFRPMQHRIPVRQVKTRISSMSVLESSRPIDRIRYQSRMVFEAFDKDNDGKLGVDELVAFLQFTTTRLGDTSEVLKIRDSLRAKAALRPGAYADFEEVVDAVRDLIKVLSANKVFVTSQIEQKELGRLVFKSCLSLNEMTTVLVMFRLLDTDSDEKLRVDELSKAQGIEAQYFENILEDADVDEDGFLSFEDFLTSYHKERPVILSALVMLAHAATFYCILQAPVDFTIRGVMAMCVLLRPMIITGPVIKIYTMFKTLFGGMMAQQEMAKRARAA